VNVIGLPLSPGDAAVTVYAPARFPRASTVDAWPAESVLAVVTLRLCPVAPEGVVAIAKTTFVPLIGFPYASLTVTRNGRGRWLLGAALWPLPEVKAIF
jgi:hypothetical protein